jgi:glycine betaine catabolism B
MPDNYLYFSWHVFYQCTIQESTGLLSYTISMHNIVKILDIKEVTHDVKCFWLEKPERFIFTPGQATEVSINKPGWEEEKRPFTFTCLNEDPYLEFTIKDYADHDGVTKHIHQLVVGDELIIRDVWGTISYNGPGYFIAGGAGITPFIAILRQLHKDNKLEGNKLFFANKTAADIIYEQELSRILGEDFINVLSDQKEPQENSNSHPNYRTGHINEEFLKKEVPDFHTHFYICGPDKMIADIKEILTRQGADLQNVVFEK